MKLAIWGLATMIVASVALSAIPETMSYQGVLKENGLVVADSAYTVTFRLYSDTTQPAIWTESQSIQTNGGVFSTFLGAITPLTLPFDVQYWLGMQLEGESEMQPRLRLASSPYALNSKGAGGWSVNGNNLSSTVSGNVGIGTSTPQAKLDVAGTVKANEVSLFGGTSLRRDGSNNHKLELGADSLPNGETSFIDFHNSIGFQRNEDFNMRIVNYGDRILHFEEPGNPGVQRRMTIRSGNVGIGNDNPQARLEVNGTLRAPDIGMNGATRFWQDANGHYAFELGPEVNTAGKVCYMDFHYGTGEAEDMNMRIENNGDHRLVIMEEGYIDRVVVQNGNVGIGVSTPAYPLDVSGDIHTSAAVVTGPFGTSMAHASIELGGPTGFTPFIDFHNSDVAGEDFDTRIIATGPDEIRIDGGNLRVGATTITNILQITGGADLAEPFPTDVDIPVGSVVVIDEKTPGRIKLSTDPYDTKVAGIVSGAGGINPGLTLQQAGILEKGQNVALTGRVYALCDASQCPIQPGDLLTTSSMPGYAMKASDHSRAHGAVIGKAMSILENGQGLVLVLVNLQ